MIRPYYFDFDYYRDDVIVSITLSFTFDTDVILPPFTSRLVKHALHTLPCMEPVRRAYLERGAYRRVTLTPLIGPRGPLYKTINDKNYIIARAGSRLTAKINVYGEVEPSVLNCTGHLNGPYEYVKVEVTKLDIVRFANLIKSSKTIGIRMHTPLLVPVKFLTPPELAEKYRDAIPNAYRLSITPGHLVAAAAKVFMGLTQGPDMALTTPQIPYRLGRLADILVYEVDVRTRPVTVVYDGNRKMRGPVGGMLLHTDDPQMALTMTTLLNLAQYMGLGKSRSIGFGMITVHQT